MRITFGKRLGALLTALVLLISCVPVFGLAAETGVTVALHYNRPDGNYDGWSVWFWVDGSEIGRAHV